MFFDIILFKLVYIFFKMYFVVFDYVFLSNNNNINFLVYVIFCINCINYYFLFLKKLFCIRLF